MPILILVTCLFVFIMPCSALYRTLALKVCKQFKDGSSNCELQNMLDLGVYFWIPAHRKNA